MVTKILLDDAEDAANEKDASKALIRLDWASQQVPANKTLSLNGSKSNSLQLAKIFIDDASDAVRSGDFGKASQRIALAEEQLPVGSLTANTIQVSEKPIVTNQKVTLKEGSNITLQGIDPNNKSLNFSIFTQPAKGAITFTKINSTSVNATYFPLEDGILTDSFSYKASNGVLDSSIGKVSLTFFPPQTSDNGNTSSNIQSQLCESMDGLNSIRKSSDMGDRAYSPDLVNIRLGDTVKWVNDDIQFHTVTSGAGPSDSVKGNEFDSGLSGPNALTDNGKTFSHTFTESGEFPYYCQLHPAMVGKVVVSKLDENPNTKSGSEQQLSEVKPQKQTPNIDAGAFEHTITRRMG